MSDVTIDAPKTPVTEGSSGMATAALPNICLIPGPVSPIPSPLPNISQSSDDPTDFSKDVCVEGNVVAIEGAQFGKSTGDSASKGTGGGVVSANAEGPAKFPGPGCMHTQIEGKGVHLLGDPIVNNCGPGGGTPNAATLPGVMQAPGGPISIDVGDGDEDEEDKKYFVEVQYEYAFDADHTDLPLGVEGAVAVCFDGSTEVGRGTLDGDGFARIDLPDPIDEVTVEFEQDPEDVQILRKPEPHPDKAKADGPWQDGMKSKLGEGAQWKWETIDGAFKTDPKAAQIVANTVIKTVSVVDEVGDVRDLAYAVVKLTDPDVQEDAQIWLGVAVILLGFKEDVGSGLKAVGKLLLESLNDGTEVSWPVMTQTVNRYARTHAVKYVKKFQSDLSSHASDAAKLLDDVLGEVKKLSEDLPFVSSRQETVPEQLDALKSVASDKLDAAFEQLKEAVGKVADQTPERKQMKVGPNNAGRPAFMKQTSTGAVDLALSARAKKSDEWIGIELIDNYGHPFRYERFKLTLPSGREVDGLLDHKGRHRREDIDAAGACTVEFPALGSPKKAEDWIEIELKDENGEPVADERFILILPDGRRIDGRLDGQGVYRCEDIESPGLCKVEFPRLQDAAVELEEGGGSG